MVSKIFKIDNNKVGRDDDNKANEIIINSSKNHESRNLTRMPNIRAIKKLIFLTFNTKKPFHYLKQAFIKVSIL